MKKKFYQIFATIMLFAFIGFGFSSCSSEDDDNDSPAKIQVRLTDAPGDYAEVLIDVKSVEIHSNKSGDEQGSWQVLDVVNKKVYNLLDFTNGMDTLLGTAELPAGKISQMRLILGENNGLKLKEGDELIPLKVPSGSQSGLKFNIHQELKDGVIYTIIIDFDAGRSIVEKGNGSYSLKPVIRAYTEATSGAIKGMVNPPETKPLISVISENDTIGGTIADDNGHFLIKGIPEGSYTVAFKPIDGYQDKSVESVSVTTGEVKDMGTVEIQK